ncbi:MAG: hypothetical protein KAU58_04870, partial [Candidatus Omnitrophica bacterium]|nr:hypothetical protein [Candidatus Omnitrophota bacterium]
DKTGITPDLIQEIFRESIPQVEPHYITPQSVVAKMLLGPESRIPKYEPPSTEEPESAVGQTESMTTIMKIILDKLKKVKAMPQVIVSAMDVSLVMDGDGKLIKGSGIEKALNGSLPEQIKTVILVRGIREEKKLRAALDDKQNKVKIIKIGHGSSITQAIIDEYQNYENIEVNPKSISIALHEDKAISMIRNDKAADKIANYAVLSNEAIAEIAEIKGLSSNDVNIFNILIGLINKGKAFLGVGISEDSERTLRNLLQGIMATMRIIKLNITEGIRDFVHSVRETSISL